MIIESLESRMLLSGNATLHPFAMAGSSPIENAATHAASTAIVLHNRSTLHFVAGAPFTVQLGFYTSPVLDPPLAYAASIDWGDGTTSSATLQYGTQGSTAGYQIIGSHTYAAMGHFKIQTNLTSGPINQPGQPPLEFPTRLIETFISKAIVSATHQTSTDGVTIGEVVGQKFSADLASFSTLAPATHLRATISWGDGVTSHGTLSPAGVIGLDVLQFNVIGAHAYAQLGTFPIRIAVTRSGVTTPIASINSTASITVAPSTISLAGTIKGTYTTPLTNPDAGSLYDFNGSGSAGALGDVSATGNVLLPGFISAGSATGTLTLTNAQGSVTLQLTGPTEAGFGPFPSTLTYSITAATGTYAGDTGNGTITATLTPAATATDARQFEFVLA